MQLSSIILSSLLATAEAAHPKYRREANDKYDLVDYEIEKFEDAISPKAFVVSLFKPEAQVWHKYVNFTNSVTIPGLSPLFPKVYCTEDYELCNFVTGEGEVNAAASVSALLASPQFNLTKTYFLVAGIAGIHPDFGTLGSAAFARYTVSIGLQYEVDIREAPANWSTGYWAYGTSQPNSAPTKYYGTEVFELNEELRDHAAKLAYGAQLADSAAANVTRKMYSPKQAAAMAPSILRCDSATSDVYFTGTILDEAFANTTKLLTNGTGNYCTTAQEDSAVLEAALRYAKFGLTDFSRWVVLRTGSDFDRPPAIMANDTVGFFEHNNTGGSSIAFENLYRAGYPFIKDVLQKWNSTYQNGTKIANATPLYVPVGQVNTTSPKITVTNYTFSVNATNYTTFGNATLNGTNSTNSTNAKNGTLAPQNYIGDVFGTLGGTPNFGNGRKYDTTLL